MADGGGGPWPAGTGSPAARAARPGPAGLAADPELRRLAAEAGGSRARWLAGLNPDWKFVTAHTQADEDAWRLGDTGQRRGYLTALRARDPGAARELIAGAGTRPARSGSCSCPSWRAGLSLADEPLLEAALDDATPRCAAGPRTCWPGCPGLLSASAWPSAPSAACASSTACAARAWSSARRPRSDAAMRRDGTRPPGRGAPAAGRPDPPPARGAGQDPASHLDRGVRPDGGADRRRAVGRLGAGAVHRLVAGGDGPARPGVDGRPDQLGPRGRAGPAGAETLRQLARRVDPARCARETSASPGRRYRRPSGTRSGCCAFATTC